MLGELLRASIALFAVNASELLVRSFQQGHDCRRSEQATALCSATRTGGHGNTAPQLLNQNHLWCVCLEAPQSARCYTYQQQCHTRILRGAPTLAGDTMMKFAQREIARYTDSMKPRGRVSVVSRRRGRLRLQLTYRQHTRIAAKSGKDCMALTQCLPQGRVFWGLRAVSSATLPHVRTVGRKVVQTLPRRHNTKDPVSAATKTTHEEARQRRPRQLQDKNAAAGYSSSWMLEVFDGNAPPSK